MSEEKTEARPVYFAPLPGLAEEVFVVVNDQAEAQFVNGRLNTPEAAELKARRMALVAAEGSVSEGDMPDVKAVVSSLKVAAKLVRPDATEVA